MTSTFEGAEIDGKQFPFVRVTIAQQGKIIRGLFKPRFRDLFSMAFRPESEKKRIWKRFRSTAFIKSGLWKWFRIIPRELRCSTILINQAEEIEARFFAYAAEKGIVFNPPSTSAKNSKTENEPIKSQD
jgi:hypothetical protein